MQKLLADTTATKRTSVKNLVGLSFSAHTILNTSRHQEKSPAFTKRQYAKSYNDGGTEDHSQIADETAGSAERNARRQVEEKQH